MSRSERPAPAAQAWTVTYQPGAISVDLAESDGSAIAEVYVWSTEGELPALKLAYLFRAAPELREALQEIDAGLQWWLESYADHDGRLGRLMSQARAALAACEPPSSDDGGAP